MSVAKTDTAVEPYYRALKDNRFASTVHAQGAWNAHEQHMAPVSGILAHCLEQFQPRPELRMARLSFDILGLIPDGEFSVVTWSPAGAPPCGRPRGGCNARIPARSPASRMR